MYFDDAAMGDALYERQSGQAAVNSITSLLLLDFDEAKHEDTDQIKDLLGVEADFSSAPHTYTARVGVTAQIKGKSPWRR